MLANELNDLCRFWDIDPGSSLATLQKQVQNKLAEHFTKIPPYKNKPSAEGGRREVFRRTFKLSFNIFLDPRDQLDKKNDRQRLIEKLGGKGATFETATRDMLFAYAEIEKQILSTGFKPQVPVSAFGIGGQPSVSDVEQPAVLEPADEPTAPDQTPDPRRSRRWLTAGGIVGVAALAVAGVVVAISYNSDAGTAGPAPGTTTASPITGPVRVGTVSYVRDGAGGWSFVLPQKAQFSEGDLAALNSLGGNGSGYVNWVLAHGGVNPDNASLSVELHGNAGGSVTITDVQVVKHCQSPLTGTLLYSPPAGPGEDLNLAIDLDQQYPVVQSYVGGKPSASYFSQQGNGHHIDLGPGEATTLQIDAITKRQYCQFSLNLVIDTPTGTVIEQIDDHGKPFQVTATITDGATGTRFASYQAMYAGGTASPARNASFVAVDPTTYK